MNLNWLVKILIGVIISAFLTIILISIWQILTPLNTSNFDNYTPFPNFTPEELPVDVTSNTPCESELVMCNMDLGCTTCSSTDFICVQPEIDGQYKIAIPGTSDEYLEIPAVTAEQKAENIGYCVQNPAASASTASVCNTFTGQWVWELDPVLGGIWECQCRYPDFFGNSSGGCIDPVACQVAGFGTISNVNNLSLTVDGAEWLKQQAVSNGQCGDDVKIKGEFCNVEPGTLYNPNASEGVSNLLLYYPPTEQVPSQSGQPDTKVPMWACGCGLINNIPSAQMPGDPYSCYIDPCYFAVGGNALNGCSLGPDARVYSAPSSDITFGSVTDIVQCTAECNCVDNGGYTIPLYTLGVLEGYNMWKKIYSVDNTDCTSDCDTRPEFPSSIFTYNEQSYDYQSPSYLKLISDMESFGVKKNIYAGLCSSMDFCNTSLGVYTERYTNNPIDNYNDSFSSTTVTSPANAGLTVEGPYTWPAIGQCNCGPMNGGEGTEVSSQTYVLRDCYGDYNKNSQGDITLNGQVDPVSGEPLYVSMEPCINPYNPVGVECYEPADLIECAHNGVATAMSSHIMGTGPFKSVKSPGVVNSDGDALTQSEFDKLDKNIGVVNPADPGDDAAYYNWNYYDTADASGLWWATGFLGTWCNCATASFTSSAILGTDAYDYGSGNSIYGQVNYNWYFYRAKQLGNNTNSITTTDSSGISKDDCKNKGPPITDGGSTDPTANLAGYIFPQSETNQANCNASISGQDSLCTDILGATGSTVTNAFSCTDATMRTWPTTDTIGNPLDETGFSNEDWGSPNLNACFWTQNPANFTTAPIPSYITNKGWKNGKCDLAHHSVNGVQTKVATTSNLGAKYTEPTMGGTCNYMNYPTNFALQLKLPEAVFQSPIYWGEDGPLEANTKYSTYGTALEHNSAVSKEYGGTSGVSGTTFIPQVTKNLQAGPQWTKNNAGFNNMFVASGWCGDGNSYHTGGKTMKDYTGTAKVRGQQNRNYTDWRNITGLGACFGGSDTSQQVGCSGIPGYGPCYSANQKDGTKSTTCTGYEGEGCTCKYCTSHPLATSNPGTIAQNANQGQCMVAGSIFPNSRMPITSNAQGVVFNSKYAPKGCPQTLKPGQCAGNNACSPLWKTGGTTKEGGNTPAYKGHANRWQPGGGSNCDPGWNIAVQDANA